MRRPWILPGVVLAAALAAWWLWPAPSPEPVAVPVVDAPREFPQVEVRAAEGQQRLTLTGVVKSQAGAPIAGAEVFLAATSQQSITDAQCGICRDRLLSCHAVETPRTVATLLAAKRGTLEPALTTTSDAEGRFRFEGLGGASFTVWGRAPGFGDGLKERAAPGDPVELILPAPRGLSGRLRDEAGAPVQGRVQVTSRRLARVYEAATDAAGRFEVQGLGEGPFAVVGLAPGRLPAMEDETQAGGEPVVLTLPLPRRLEVSLVSNGKPIDGVVQLAGDHLDRQLASQGGQRIIEELYPGELVVSAVAGALSSAPQRVTLSGPVTRVTLTLEPGGTVAVSVLDEADQPVVAPTLDLLTREGALVTSRATQTGAVTTFGPLGSGEYRILAQAPGYQTAMVPVTVKPGETGVEITMTRGVVISGRVEDEYGRPAPGVSVLVSPMGDTVLADEAGRFLAVVPSPGLYELHAHHSDWGGVDLKVTAPKTDVVLALEPKAGTRVTVLAGGRRVEGASVTLFHAQGSFRSDRSSGADGVVLMRGLPPDSYTLVAIHPDYLPSERQALVLRDGDLLDVQAELKEGAALTGVVVDTQGAPVEGVTVATTPRVTEAAVTDAIGQFALKPLRAKAAYGVRVMKQGLDQVERTIGVAGGPPVRVVVHRQPLFRGRVLGEGQPLRHFRVEEHEVTSPDGRFELALPAAEERVVLVIEAPGYEPLMVERPSTPDLGDFDLKRVPPVTGVVHDEVGTPVVDAVVTCSGCDQSVLTGVDGRFSLGKPGFLREFTVVAKKGRRTAARTVSEGAMQGLELVLRPGVKLSGLAVLPDGQPAAGVEITGVHVDRGETLSVVTNADGTYATEVAPGTYRLMLNAPSPNSSDPMALVVELQGAEARVNFGPVPGAASLAVRLKPMKGFALWLVKGELPAVGNPPMELLRAPWAMMVYQPLVERVTLSGLEPGRYTLVWGSFHTGLENGPVRVAVSVPDQVEVALVP